MGRSKTFQSSLPDLIRQSMQRPCSLSLSVPPYTPGVTMDHRVKPGGDAVGSVWSILHVKFESPDQSNASSSQSDTLAARLSRVPSCE